MNSRHWKWKTRTSLPWSRVYRKSESRQLVMLDEELLWKSRGTSAQRLRVSRVMAESFRRMSVRAQQSEKVGSLSPPLTHPGVCFYLCWWRVCGGMCRNWFLWLNTQKRIAIIQGFFFKKKGFVIQHHASCHTDLIVR